MYGNISATGTINIAEDTDTTATIGRLKIGNIGYNNWAGFSHLNRSSQGNFALMQNSVGQTVLNCSTGQIISFNENNVDKMTLKDGKIGIGFSNPLEKLHVDGNIKLSGSIDLGGNIKISDTYSLMNSSGTCKIHFNDGKTIINTQEGKYISFNINNKERIQISEYKDSNSNYHGTIAIPNGNIKINDTYSLMNTTGNCKINFKNVTDNGVTKGVTYIDSNVLRVDQLYVDRVF